MPPSPPSDSSLTRRALLAGVAAGAAGGTSGCLQRMQAVTGQDSPEQVKLEIKTVPADDDRAATKIAQQLEENLTAVGADTDRVLLREAELRRDVLINRDFDIFVARYPSFDGPDFLRTLLQSKFANESGWQNPYDFTNLDIDEMLHNQRVQTGLDRSATVSKLQQEVAREQPFITVAIPDDIHAVRTDRFRGFGRFPLRSTLALLSVEYIGDDERVLRLAATDDRITRSLNPIGVEYRTEGTITELLYEPLARRYDGDVRPWLASGWEMSGETDRRYITVELREGLTWHDGTELTVDDIVFTYRFLQDTTLGEREPPVPAPRFRRRTSLVADVERLDSSSVRLVFDDVSEHLALQSLTVPLFPASEWEDSSGDAEIAGVSASSNITEALVKSNSEPVGSGPLQFEESTTGETLRLTRFEDHFLTNGRYHGLRPDRFEEGLDLDGLRIDIVRSDEAAVLLVEEGEADATLSPLSPAVVPRIGQNSSLDLQVDETQAFYQVGFNTQRHPLGNPHVRRGIARLLDKEHIVSEVFDGFAAPATSPLARTDWLPPSMRWDGTDAELPFFGSAGELDVDSAKETFRDAGFQYDEDGTLLQR